MLAKAYIGHHVENRIRFYLPDERGNVLLFSKIENKISRCIGVEEVHTNSLTGSVLVIYEGSLSKVIECAKTNELFEIDPTLKQRKTWTQDFLRKLNKIDRHIIHATEGELNLASLAALGLLGAGAFQLSRRNFFPAASTLITDAMRLLLKVNRSIYERTDRSRPSENESTYNNGNGYYE